MLATKKLQANLEKRIKDALDSDFSEKSDSDKVKSNLAKSLSTIISEEVESWIKTAEVTVDAGITVITSGSASSQTGTTTSTGRGSIS